uniref:Immunoglobulin V-set domain-containing protein n=1 Tax=Zonotrichia albicollis TaxID=44394 RepID=A0A8D2MAR2_ZONAL
LSCRGDCGSFLLSAAVTGQVALEQQPREVTVNYLMYWYRQGPRGSLEWICRDSYSYGEGFQDRFKARKDSSQNSYTLQILAAEPGDAATYYFSGHGISTAWDLY